MKCPHCLTKVGLFSKEMSDIGKSKLCPQCSKAVKFGIRHGRFAIAFFCVALVSILVGASGPIAAGVAGGLGAAFGIGLKRAEG